MGSAITVDVGVNSTRFDRGLDAMRQRAARWRSSVGASLGGAVAGAVGVGVIRNTMQDIDRLQKIGRRLGLPVEVLQRFGYAAEQSGADVEQLYNALTRLARKSEMMGTDKGIAQAFADLNVDVEKFKAARVDEKFLQLADAYAAAGNKGKAFAALFKIMEDDTKNLLPLLAEGGRGIEELGDQIVAVTDEQADAIARYNDSVNRMSTNFKTAMGTSIAFVVDRLEEMMAVLIEVAGLVSGMVSMALTGDQGDFSRNTTDLLAGVKEEREWQAEQRRKATAGGDGEGGGGGGGGDDGTITAGEIRSRLKEYLPEGVFERLFADFEDAALEGMFGRHTRKGFRETAREFSKPEVVLDQFRKIGGNAGGSLVIDTNKKILRVQESIDKTLDRFHRDWLQKPAAGVAQFGG